MTTRRSFLRAGAATLAGLPAISTASAFEIQAAASKSSAFLEILRVPDLVAAYPSFHQTVPTGRVPLARTGERWAAQKIEVETKLQSDSLVLTLHSPALPIAAVHVRWNLSPATDLLILGDAWERSYGELGWRNIIPERVLPWYFATFDGHACHAYGVKTDVRALCFWQLDPEGVSLWLNVTNGGNGVELGERLLTMATVVTHRGDANENAIDSISHVVPENVRPPIASHQAHLRRQRLVL